MARETPTIPWGELHEAHRIVERGDDRAVNPEGHPLNKQNVQLKRPYAHRRREHPANHQANGLVIPGPHPVVAKAFSPEGGELKHKLRHARREGTPMASAKI